MSNSLPQIPICMLVESQRQAQLAALLSDEYRICKLDAVTASCEDCVVPEVLILDQTVDVRSSDYLQQIVDLDVITSVLVVGEYTTELLPIDLQLAADATGREIVTAIELLAQIARLRRRQLDELADNRKFRDWAMRDPLTGLFNRRAWNLELKQRLPSYTPRTACVALIDLDSFKSVNDSGGLALGDAVLQGVANALGKSLRDDDFVARLGGDEFGFVLSGLEQDAATSIVDRVRRNTTTYLAQQGLPAPTISAGCVFADVDDRCTADTLFERASQSLRDAKESSKNCTVASAFG